MKFLVLFLPLLAALSLLSPAYAEVLPKTISNKDSHLFITPENWVRENGNLETNSPGAYLKIGFTGTSFQMVVDSSAQMPEKKNDFYFQNNAIAGPHQELPKIGIQVDGGSVKSIILPSAGPSVVVPLVTGLAPGDHQIRISLEGLGRDNRWYFPTDQLIIKNFLVDADANTISPRLRPKRMVVFGDSITEGASVYGTNGTVADKQWSVTWDAMLADKLNAEVSVIAYQAQGYGNPGAGQVPCFFQSYASLRGGGHPRWFSKPDYVFVLQGTNGGAQQNEVVIMMKTLRAIYPTSELVFGVNFNGLAREEITGAFKLQKAGDLKLQIFDLGEDGSSIVYDHSFDHRHPNAEGHSLLANLIFAQLIQLF